MTINPDGRQSEGVTPSGSGCQPTASAAEEASSQSGIPNAYRRDPYYGPAKNWRRFYDYCEPLKTCPASRHTRMITEELRDPKSRLRRRLIDAGFEPDHMASSIEVTVASLWEARRWLKWEMLPATKRYKYNGHWVPDASAMSAFGQDPQGLEAKPASAVPERQTPKVQRHD